MLNTLWMLLLVGGTDFQIKMEDLGFYEPGLRLYQFQDDLLFISSLESGIALVNNAGRVYKKYQQEGLGPKELHLPYVLGISDRIIVVSNLKTILVFDKDLHPKTGVYPPLPNVVASGSSILHGWSLGNNEYLLIHKAWSPRTHAISGLRFTKSEWHETPLFFPQKYPPESATADKGRNYQFNFHNGILFKTTGVGDDWYEVSVMQPPRKKGDEDAIIQMLAGNLEEFPLMKPGYRVYMGETFKTGFGYAVTFKIGFLPADRKFMADLFDSEGKFLKRMPLPSNAIPCVNCEEVLIEGETPDGKEILKRLVITLK